MQHVVFPREINRAELMFNVFCNISATIGSSYRLQAKPRRQGTYQCLSTTTSAAKHEIYLQREKCGQYNLFFIYKLNSVNYSFLPAGIRSTSGMVYVFVGLLAFQKM